MGKSVKAVLFDIEGTTTPITFVTEVLFPYAKKNLKTYLESHRHSKELAEVIDCLREQYNKDVAAGMSGVPKILSNVSCEIDDTVLESVYKNLLWQMSLNRKTTSLKQLQGNIWRDGYKRGILKGDIYPDVLPAFEQLKNAGKLIYIYSSGSIEAQKLLFENSVKGNILHLIQGHFDTTTGDKKSRESYIKIAKSLNLNSDEILFFTDVQAEADAAIASGMRVNVVVRPGNIPFESYSDYTVIENFEGLSLI